MVRSRWKSKVLMPLPIVAGAVLGTVVKTAIKEAVTNVTAKTVVTSHPVQVAKDVVEALASDPKFVNATNSEAPMESRVTLGSATGFLGGLAFLLPVLLKQFGINVSTDYILQLGGAVLAVWGPAYSLYGRWMPGLKPLFSSISGKVMGFAALGAVIVAAGIVILRLI